MRMRKGISMFAAALLVLSLAACGSQPASVSVSTDPVPVSELMEEKKEEPEASVSETKTETVSETSVGETDKQEPAPVEKNGEVYVLFTSDVHCGVDHGFGYAGLKQIRDNLEAKGYTTILVDDGDAIQGEPIGTLSKGEAIVKLMNQAGYDLAIPGNHEFDYGMDRFLELADMAEYKYISCNFNHNGEPVFDPYAVIEAAGLKIGFVGITTPHTITSSTPAYFKDETGAYVYGFMQGDDGTAVYNAVQSAADKARSEGADLVYVMGHMGNEADCVPYTYVDIISHTTGIDVFLDGHSHDTDQIVMKNAAGENVTRSACGTKLNCIGYSHIGAEGEVIETGIWSWPNGDAAWDLFGIDNDMKAAVSAAKGELDESLKKVVAKTVTELTINDPTAKDGSGNPIRIVRRAETNLGDLCADAYRDQSGAEIAIVNGGGIRSSLKQGDITFGDIINVHPFGNMLTVVEVTGQQLLDALEWGVRAVPEQFGGFPQVSGITFEIHTDIESPCKANENGEFESVSAGKRRVQNVLVAGEPIDPKKIYSLAGHNYTLLNGGDGYTMFAGAKILQNCVKLDNQVLIDYVADTLGGVIGEEYADPYGQGRITIVE